MDVWVHLSDSVAHGIVVLLAVIGGLTGLFLYARITKTELFPVRGRKERTS